LEDGSPNRQRARATGTIGFTFITRSLASVMPPP
jgi:hypothetical protein